MSIGPSLEAIRKDLRLMPTASLVQYKQNPSKQAFDGVPMDMLAGLELSRRAQLQQEQLAKTAPNPQQMPTVVDQAAQQLAGMPPQGMPPQGVPQQAPQFASAPPQQAPQAPQQQAQAPQAPQPPAQPTQQQPQKLAVGGIATLGDMEQVNSLPQAQMAPQGNPLMTNQGSPIVQMAGGGIVAFANNKDQPVDANMPATDSGVTWEQVEAARKRRDALDDTPWYMPTPESRKAPLAAAKQEYEDLMGRYREAAIPRAKAEYQQQNPQYRTETVTDTTKTPSGDTNKLKITDVPDNAAGNADIMKLLSRTGGGGGMSPEVKNAIKEMNVISGEAKNLKSPEIPEADRERMIEEQFKKNQEASRPVFEQQSKMLQEARDANERRREDAASNARLRFGLGLFGSKSPTIGGGIKEAALPAMDAYDRAAELADAAEEKNRQAEMDLARSKLMDEKGDRKSAQEYFDSYQRNKREAYNAQVQSLQLRASAAKMPAELSLHQQQVNAQADNAGLRALMMANRLGPRQLTIPEKLALDKRAAEVFANPASPEFQKYVGAFGGAQLMADLKNGRIKPDNPQFQSILNRAKERYMTDMTAGTRSAAASGIPTMDSLEQQ